MNFNYKLFNLLDMSEENNAIEIKENVIYYYYGNGTKFYTSNLSFAETRSTYYGSNEVYVEKLN